jgi:hypothetical protein
MSPVRVGGLSHRIEAVKQTSCLIQFAIEVDRCPVEVVATVSKSSFAFGCPVGFFVTTL